MEEYPPGFRFFPTEEELVSFYLHNQLEGKRVQELNQVIPVLDVYQHEPWSLPELAGELCYGDTEQWFFFVPRQEREARGGRPNRTTASGYWKATGSPSYVYSSHNRVIGLKKTMVFYKGKAPNGRKTKWKMNEYRAIEEDITNPSSLAIPKLRHELSVCRVYVISGSCRAFDRRPLETTTLIETGAQSQQPKAASSSSHNTTIMEKTSSSSSDSSGSGEDHDVQNTNWEMIINGLEPLSEWEQFNWL